MNGRLTFIPLLWASPATQVITEQSGIAIGLAVVAIVGTAVLFYRAGRKEQQVVDRLRRLEDDVIELKGKRK